MKTAFLRYGIAVMAACAVISAKAQNNGISKYKTGDRVGYNGSEYLYADDDSSVNPVQTIVAYCRGRDKYDFTVAGNKLLELYVNNRKIPADSFYVYNSLVKRLSEQIKKDRVQAEEDRRQAALDRQQAERDRQQGVKDQAQAEEDRKQAELDRQQAERDRQQSLKDQAEAGEDRKQADLDRQQAERDRQQAVKDRAQAEEDRKQAELDRQQAEEDRKLIDSLLNDIVTAQIVPDRKSIKHVILDDDELIVNGKLQPEEIFRKFKTKYVKKSGYSLNWGSYGYNIHSEGE